MPAAQLWLVPFLQEVSSWLGLAGVSLRKLLRTMPLTLRSPPPEGAAAPGAQSGVAKVGGKATDGGKGQGKGKK